MFQRTMPVDLELRQSEDGEPSIIHLSASSEYAVKRGMYTEVLDHSRDAITNIARGVLYNHDADWLIGTVRATDLVNKRTTADIEMLPDAKLPSGVDVRAAVESGALTGVSIGYSIDEYERSEDEDGVTIRATKWTIREISLTPIPADHTVGIGRAEDDDAFARFIHPKSAESGEESDMSEDIIPQPADDKREAEVVTPSINHVEVARHAEELGLVASKYLDDADWQTSMLKDAAASRKVADVGPSVEVVKEADDKLNERTIGGLLSGDLGAIADFARAHGVKIADWSKAGLADFVFNPQRGTRAAEVSANFSQVTQLAGNKAMLDAYNEQRVNWNMIADSQTTGDFKVFRNSALQLGDLAEVAEGNAATDITIDDAGGSGTLTYRGRIIELTKQAIYNDELGQFFTALGRLGGVGARHVEKSVFAALEAANFAGATAAIALGSAGLNTAWTNYMAINGPAGERRSAVPARLVVPSALYVVAKEITTSAQGETTTRVFASGEDYIMPVHAKYLTDANDWYLCADPSESPVLTVLTHRDYPAPRMFEIDAGANISRKFRIEFPLQVIANTEGTNVPMGAYKATQA